MDGQQGEAAKVRYMMDITGMRDEGMMKELLDRWWGDVEQAANAFFGKEEQSRREEESLRSKRAKLEAAPTPAPPLHFVRTREFALIILVQPDDTCSEMLARCESTCPDTVHSHCFQRAGTLHFTLFQGSKLTYEQAMSVSFDGASRDCFPVFNLTGFKSWAGSVCCGSDTDISGFTSKISCNFKFQAPSQNDLHMSIYRPRGKRGVKETFDKVKRIVKGPYGTARGTRLVLKEMHADYHGLDGKFFRVIL